MIYLSLSCELLSDYNLIDHKNNLQYKKLLKLNRNQELMAVHVHDNHSKLNFNIIFIFINQGTLLLINICTVVIIKLKLN